MFKSEPEIDLHSKIYILNSGHSHDQT